MFIFVITASFLALSQALPVDAFTVTLDPGHTFDVPGAHSCSGIGEVVFNDALVKGITRELETDGYQVRITRTGNISPKLWQRGPVAKESDLFLSVHHDSVQPRFLQYAKKRRGRYLKVCSDYARGFSLFISRKNILPEESKEFALSIARALVARGFKPTLHHAEDVPGERKELIDPELGVYYYDNLVVLKTAPVPAVLIEAGVIVHPEEAKTAATVGFRESFAKAVAEGLTSKNTDDPNNPGARQSSIVPTKDKVQVVIRSSEPLPHGSSAP